jgi:hypothetical protein
MEISTLHATNSVPSWGAKEGPTARGETLKTRVLMRNTFWATLVDGPIDADPANRQPLPLPGRIDPAMPVRLWSFTVKTAIRNEL